MDLEKILYAIGTAFLAVFLMCTALVLANKVNMWIVGVISLIIAITAFVATHIVTKKSRK